MIFKTSDCGVANMIDKNPVNTMRERGGQTHRINNQRPSSHDGIGLWRRLALALLHEWIGLGRVVLNVNVVVVKVHFVVAVLLLLLLIEAEAERTAKGS